MNLRDDLNVKIDKILNFSSYMEMSAGLKLDIYLQTNDSFNRVILWQLWYPLEGDVRQTFSGNLR